MPRRLVWMICCSVLLAFGLACSEGRLSEPAQGLDRRAQALTNDRFLVVHHEQLLQGFSLERLMNQLALQGEFGSGVGGMRALTHFQQLWDTQNTALGRTSGGPYCNSHLTPDGFPGLGDSPWQCPRHEAYQAEIDPFGADPLYAPVGIFNRFDLAPVNGSHCGEYRIVYAMRSAHPLAEGFARNYMIFEAVLPNPTPELGLLGCLPVAEFWLDLHGLPDAVAAAELETFFFHGLPGFPPVVHVDHYGLSLDAEGGACATGQIRTNQFTEAPWTMREFQLVRDCRCGPCTLRAQPVTVKTNPIPRLFTEDFANWPTAPDLAATLASQVASLSASNLNEITYEVADHLNAAESAVDDSDDYPLLAATHAELHDAIQAALPPGASLTSDHILERALTQSCAGCHLLSDGRDLGGGVTWPFSLGFVHIEDFPDASGAYALSPALEDEFLPYRRDILFQFLSDPGQYPSTGSSCHQQASPSLELSAVECAAAAGSPRLPAGELSRGLRATWEGGPLLGRSSGH